MHISASVMTIICILVLVWWRYMHISASVTTLTTHMLHCRMLKLIIWLSFGLLLSPLVSAFPSGCSSVLLLKKLLRSPACMPQVSPCMLSKRIMHIGSCVRCFLTARVCQSTCVPKHVCAKARVCQSTCVPKHVWHESTAPTPPPQLP